MTKPRPEPQSFHAVGTMHVPTGQAVWMLVLRLRINCGIAPSVAHWFTIAERDRAIRDRISG